PEAAGRGKLMLEGALMASVALIGVALFAVVTEGQREPASAATEASNRSPVYAASVSGVDEAARELDLIRPSRPKQASDFTISLVSGDTLKLAGKRGTPVVIAA